MGLSLEGEIAALRFTLDYAAKRWPNANRVTCPELVADIEEAKERLRRLEARAADRVVRES